MLAPDDAAAAGERICDIVRDMFTCKSMDDVAKVLKLIAASPEIEVLRFKDRFAHPSAGWRDARINYRIKGSTHVCEVQVAHEKLLLCCGKEMGGRDSYAEERHAREILEFLGADLPAGPQSARQRAEALGLMKLLTDARVKVTEERLLAAVQHFEAEEIESVEELASLGGADGLTALIKALGLPNVPEKKFRKAFAALPVSAPAPADAGLPLPAPLRAHVQLHAGPRL